MKVFDFTKIKTTEKELNEKWLLDCIKEMGKQEVLFQNECQFQFALAWAIQNFFDKKYTISLEDFTFSNESIKIERWYTDIIVVDNETKDCIAIELKYKTSEIQANGKSILLEQGAQGFGRFDFLWDVNRNEMLIFGQQKLADEQLVINYSNSTRRIPIVFDASKCSLQRRGQIKVAYSIILTNCKKYWEDTKRPCQDEDFKITDNKVISKGVLLQWKLENGEIKSNDIRDKERGRALKFLSSYNCCWKDYCKFKFNSILKQGKRKTTKIDNNQFKFLIFETKIKNNP